MAKDTGERILDGIEELTKRGVDPFDLAISLFIAIMRAQGATAEQAKANFLAKVDEIENMGELPMFDVKPD